MRLGVWVGALGEVLWDGKEGFVDAFPPDVDDDCEE